MLQNRVNPFGEIISTEARGTWWGNRGALHSDGKEILRPFKLEAWITCLLDYKGITRRIMGPGRLTELFFLDEATSFAAGHRPCALCRRPAYHAFKLAWLKGNSQYGFDEKTSIREIDHILHAERVDEKKSKVMYDADPRALPEGVMIVYNGEAYLLNDKKMYRWTAFGYEQPIGVPRVKKVKVLTPQSTVNAFRGGYSPAMKI